MEPVFMVLGQSSATAAVQAIEQGVRIQEIDPARLKARLESDGQVLDFESAPLAPRQVVRKAQLSGVVVDDLDAMRTGFDRNSAAHSTYLESGYHHDDNARKGSQTARFVPDLPEAGYYQVLVAYPWNGNRASNVPVVIRHADGEAKVTVDQKKKPAVRNLFHPVGTFRFKKGKSGYVEISNAGTEGYVAIDGVQWIPVP